MLKNSEIKTAHGGRRDTPYGTQPALLKNLEAKIAHGGRSLTDPNFEHLWTCGWEPGLPGIPRSGNRPGIYAGHKLALRTDESPVYGALRFAALANQVQLKPWPAAS